MSAMDVLARQIANANTVDATLIGVFQGLSGSLCFVDVGDARVAVPSLSATPPIPGESVRLIRVNAQTFLWGPTATRAAFGRVVVVGADVARVEYPSGSGVERDMMVPDGLILALGDVVSIDWMAGGVIANRYTNPPTYVLPAAPTGPDAGGRTVEFTALQSGSWGATYGWNTPDVYASDSYTGAWFYGTKIADSIPDTATITAAEIYLPIRKNSGGNPIFGVHTSPSRPEGNVTFTTTAALTTRSGWVTIRTTYMDALKSALGGVGFDHGGYSIWNGIDGQYRDAQSGTLRVTYNG